MGEDSYNTYLAKNLCPKYTKSSHIPLRKHWTFCKIYEWALHSISVINKCEKGLNIISHREMKIKVKGDTITHS